MNSINNRSLIGKVSPFFTFFIGVCILSLLTIVGGCKEPTKAGALQQFETVNKILKSGDYREAFPMMMKLAENDNPFAQRSVGWMYSNGFGVEQDIFQAISWYEKAIKNGSGDAVAMLADVYAYGIAGFRNCELALELLKTGVSFNAVEPLLTLGDYYGYGICVDKDFGKRDHYYGRALKTGLLTPVLVGSIYFQGYGGRDSFKKGVQLVMNHCEDNLVICGAVLGQAYSQGLGISQNKEKAFEYYLLAAENGHSGAQYNVGYYYVKGEWVNKNVKAGLYWLKKAASKNQATALSLLGYLYETGLSGETDLDLALEYYERAAFLGENRAISKLKLLSSRQ